MAESSPVERIQSALSKAGIAAWLFYDFREIDPIAVRTLNFGEGYHATRRWFYLVPAQGTPRKLVHRIESGQLDHLPGEKLVYLRWQELQDGLRRLLAGQSQVAMQFSSIPYCSRIDGGTLDLVRGCGVEVIPSQDLVQEFEAVWSSRQLAQHRHAAEFLTSVVNQAFTTVSEQLGQGQEVFETDVQDFILSRFEAEGMVTDSPPIVGANGNAGDPHYSPQRGDCASIRRGDFLLIDLWCKEADAGAVFGDITWTGYFGLDPSPRIREVFDVVTRARDQGYELLRERFEAGRPVYGWEVDDATRKVIDQAGFGDYFVHRTGHNLGEETHGNGVNFDNLETHDDRRVIQGIGCTIEPGVYLPDFGVRSEINIYMGSDGPEITTPPQRELLLFQV